MTFAQIIGLVDDLTLLLIQTYDGRNVTEVYKGQMCDASEEELAEYEHRGVVGLWNTEEEDGKTYMTIELWAE